MSEERVITSQPTFEASPRLLAIPRKDVREVCEENGDPIPLKPLITIATDEKPDEKELDDDFPTNPADCCCFIADDDPLASYCLCRTLSNFFVKCGLCTEICLMKCFMCICDCPECCNSANSGYCYCCGEDCRHFEDCMHCLLGVSGCILCFNVFGYWNH